MRRSSLLAALVALAAAALPQRAPAQAVEAGVQTLEISLYAAAARIATGFNSTEYGYLAGGDFTRHFRTFDAALELRGTHGAGPVVSEKTLTGGFKVAKRFHRFTPYLDLLAGEGFINYTHPAIYASGIYASDTGIVYVFGGGIDYVLNRRFSLKADDNLQSWSLGAEAPRFTPNTFSLGLVYHIPFDRLPNR